MNLLYTIGHSNHSMDVFLSLLKLHRVEVIADVRTIPHSRWVPWFSRPSLEKALADEGLQYIFLGKELGARREEAECCAEGAVVLERVALLPIFKAGL